MAQKFLEGDQGGKLKNLLKIVDLYCHFFLLYFLFLFFYSDHAEGEEGEESSFCLYIMLPLQVIGYWLDSGKRSSISKKSP